MKMGVAISSFSSLPTGLRNGVRSLPSAAVPEVEAIAPSARGSVVSRVLRRAPSSATI